MAGLQQKAQHRQHIHLKSRLPFMCVFQKVKYFIVSALSNRDVCLHIFIHLSLLNDLLFSFHIFLPLFCFSNLGKSAHWFRNCTPGRDRLTCLLRHQFKRFLRALIMRIKERWWQVSSLVGIHKHARMVKSSIICKNRLIDFCLRGRKAVNTKMSFIAPRQRFLFDEETECANTALFADELQRYSFCFISFKAFFPLTESAIIKRFSFKWMSHDFISGDKIWWSTMKYTATATALRVGNRLH